MPITNKQKKIQDYIILQKIRLDTDTQKNNTNNKKNLDVANSVTILKIIKRSCYFFISLWDSARIEWKCLLCLREGLYCGCRYKSLVSVVSIGLRGDPCPHG